MPMRRKSSCKAVGLDGDPKNNNFRANTSCAECSLGQAWSSDAHGRLSFRNEIDDTREESIAQKKRRLRPYNKKEEEQVERRKLCRRLHSAQSPLEVNLGGGGRVIC